MRYSLYKTKPSEYIGHLIGHEGEGSVLSLLRYKRWATGVSAGISGSGYNSSSCCATFCVTFYLTKVREGAYRTSWPLHCVSPHAVRICPSRPLTLASCIESLSGTLLLLTPNDRTSDTLVCFTRGVALITVLRVYKPVGEEELKMAAVAWCCLVASRCFVVLSFPRQCSPCPPYGPTAFRVVPHATLATHAKSISSKSTIQSRSRGTLDLPFLFLLLLSFVGALLSSSPLSQRIAFGAFPPPLVRFRPEYGTGWILCTSCSATSAC